MLIDIKTSRITKRDVDRMDACVHAYDEAIKYDYEGPTLGILLCAGSNDEIARYSVSHGNEQLLATTYQTILPDEEQLRAVMERQKALFQLRQAEALD